MSDSKEIWYWYLTITKIMTTYLKRMKNAYKTGQIIFMSHGQEHDIPSHWKVYWKMSWFEHNFLQNWHRVHVPKAYALSRSYLYFGILRFVYYITKLWSAGFNISCSITKNTILNECIYLDLLIWTYCISTSRYEVGT